MSVFFRPQSNLFLVPTRFPPLTFKVPFCNLSFPPPLIPPVLPRFFCEQTLSVPLGLRFFFYMSALSLFLCAVPWSVYSDPTTSLLCLAYRSTAPSHVYSSLSRWTFVCFTPYFSDYFSVSDHSNCRFAGCLIRFLMPRQPPKK